jgi:hypothetical protein
MFPFFSASYHFGNLVSRFVLTTLCFGNL